MTLLDELREGIRKKEEQERSLGGRVLLFGPADEKGKRKRRNLAARLKRIGFEVHNSESLSRSVSSFLTAYQQEEEHWRLFDQILILNFSHGASQEIAAFVHDPEFRRRAYVVYPERFDPVYSTSFGSEVLRGYPFKERVTEEEWENCKASDKCLDFARARRAIDVELLSRTP